MPGLYARVGALLPPPDPEYSYRWLNELRQIDAASMISDGKSVKETALELGYKHPAHFSRDFKRSHGQPPTAAQSTISPPSLL